MFNKIYDTFWVRDAETAPDNWAIVNPPVLPYCWIDSVAHPVATPPVIPTRYANGWPLVCPSCGYGADRCYPCSCTWPRGVLLESHDIDHRPIV